MTPTPATAVPTITGVSHVDLTVTDLDRSEAFYTELLGAVPLLQGANETHGTTVRYVLHADSFLIIGLVRHDAPIDEPFDPRRVGLDHLAFNVADRTGLDEWKARLVELGVVHSEIHEEEMWDVLAARDPDGIQIEFFVTKPAAAALIGG